MKLPKYNLAYSTRAQLQLLAINAGERKHDIVLVIEQYAHIMPMSYFH